MSSILLPFSQGEEVFFLQHHDVFPSEQGDAFPEQLESTTSVVSSVPAPPPAGLTMVPLSFSLQLTESLLPGTCSVSSPLLVMGSTWPSGISVPLLYQWGWGSGATTGALTVN